MVRPVNVWRKVLLVFLLPALCVCFSVPPLSAAWQNAPGRNEQKPPQKPEKAEGDTPEPKPAITHHKITIHGQTIEYTATAARMPIRNDEGKVEARMFYVAYTADNGGPRRPLTFAFNGGPGSATIWLHMGAFGPKRVKLDPNGFMPPPPFTWEDNPNTLLDKSDLVFVDAIGTGYSRPETPDLGKKFWSVSGDIQAFGQFIHDYLQQYSRWTSPLYLAGESYGTTRAAGLSGYLVDHGIALNGVVLISTVLSFQTIAFAPGNELPYVLYVPSYAMVAAYHHKLAPDLAKDPQALRSEVEKWAATEYLVALQKGDALPAAEKEAVAERLARYTGLSKEYILRCNLRVDLSHFDSDLLRSEGKMVGRLDGRFTAPEAEATEQQPDFDPSEARLRPPYTAVFGQYVKQELDYQTELQYYVLGGGISHWDYQTTGWSGFADTAPAMRKAFAKNPYMHVFVAEGMYDTATPYFAVDYTFDHMGLTPAEHQNVSKDHFDAGHMVYIDSKSLDKLRGDIDKLYDTTETNESK